MSLSKETLAEIENELRSLSRSAADSCRYNERTAVFGKPLFVYLSELADRIDAARKRERDELVYSFDPTMAGRSKMPDPSAYAIEGMKGFEERKRNKEPSVGNAAAMREALEMMCSLFDKGVICTSYANTQEEMEQIEELYRKAKAARSAPPRNCDKYRDYESLCRAWENAVRVEGITFGKWLFAPAAEWEGESDGE